MIDANAQTALSLPTWFLTVLHVFQQVPFYIWGAIAWEESGFNPNTHNTGTPGHPEDSVGLFQLNRRGGLGAGYSVAYLSDPVNNATIAYQSIKAAWDRYGDDIAQIAVKSGHPGDIDPSDPRVQRIVRTSNWIKSISNPLDAAKQLLSGVQLPDPAAIGSGFASGVGESIVGAVTGSVKGWFSSFKSKTLDGMIDMLAPTFCMVTGFGLVWTGIQWAVIKSPPVQAAADAAIALAPGPGKVAGVAVKTVGGGGGGSRAAAGVATDEVRGRRARSAAAQREAEQRERTAERERVATERQQEREAERGRRETERERARVAREEDRRAQGEARPARPRRRRATIRRRPVRAAS